MTTHKKTRSEMILDALMTGKPFILKEITQSVCDASGEQIKIQDIGSLIARLSNPQKCEIAHFIEKFKNFKRFEYSLVPEILKLTPEEIYDLTRSTGKDRFTLRMAVKKIPELKKYVRKMTMPSGKEASGKTRAGKKKSAKEFEMTEEAAIQKFTFQNFKDAFREEILRIGGLQLNFSLTAKLLKK